MPDRSWPPRPTLGSAFYKAHGLGNDYLVFKTGSDWVPTVQAVSVVCHRTRGIGSDGIVVLDADSGPDPFLARMFNPDGSEFERSGNGLRILASYLSREGMVDEAPFHVDVAGQTVEMIVHSTTRGIHDVSVDMGRARTGPHAIGLAPDALDSNGQLPGPDGRPLDVVPVWVGNPHVVVLGTTMSDEVFEAIGPWLATHKAIAHGTNVQLARGMGEGRMFARIWERGVGPTSASGTSACAVATASVERELQPPGLVHVETAGGVLQVGVAPDLAITLRGPVAEVAEGRLLMPGPDPVP